MSRLISCRHCTGKTRAVGGKTRPFQWAAFVLARGLSHYTQNGNWASWDCVKFKYMKVWDLFFWAKFYGWLLSHGSNQSPFLMLFIKQHFFYVLRLWTATMLNRLEQIFRPKVVNGGPREQTRTFCYCFERGNNPLTVRCALLVTLITYFQKQLGSVNWAHKAWAEIGLQAKPFHSLWHISRKQSSKV